MRGINDNCGVIGVYARGSVAAPFILSGLSELQHRGQESAGISTFNESEILTRKGMGLVYDVFDPNDELTDLPGEFGIGHTRYSTAGSSSENNAQPIVLKTHYGRIAVAHNGNLPNADVIKKDLLNDGDVFIGTSDTEVLTHLIAKGNDVVDGIKEASKVVKGAYSLTILSEDGIFAVRDPFAVRPLVLGEGDTGYGVASESCAFYPLGMEIIRDVNPGEIVYVSEGGVWPVGQLFGTPKNRASCIFEHVYLARPNSVVDGKPIMDGRENLGRRLAQKDREAGFSADAVGPIPNSGIASAIGYHHESGLPYEQVFTRTRHGRTFILPGDRLAAVKRKLHPNPGSVKGQRIVLSDDSVVRGHTAEHAATSARDKAGAEEVHLRIASPPVRHPCYLGVDIKNTNELFANGKREEEIAKALNADSIRYQTLDDMIDALGFTKDEVCAGCWTGKYPALE
jgi:amidophosphoribosyltransferase